MVQLRGVGTPTLVPGGTPSTSWAANTATIPGLTLNDWIALVVMDWAGQGSTFTNPTGWTTTIAGNDGVPQNIGLHVWTKFAAASNPNFNITVSPAQGGIVIPIAYYDVDLTTPVDAHNATFTDSLTSIVTPAVAASVDGDVILLIVAKASGNSATVPYLSQPAATSVRANRVIAADAGPIQVMSLFDFYQAQAGTSRQYTSILTGEAGTYGTVGAAIAIKNDGSVYSSPSSMQWAASPNANCDATDIAMAGLM